MELAFLRFFESVPAALAVGLLLLPRLIGESGERSDLAVALLAFLRAALGFGLIVATARAIIPADKPIDFTTLVDFIENTVVGKAWSFTQLVAILFAALATARLAMKSEFLDRVTLGVGALVIITVSVTGHAIDDSLPFITQASFHPHGRRADLAGWTSWACLVDVFGARQAP